MNKNLSLYEDIYNLLLKNEMLINKPLNIIESRKLRIIAPYGGFGNHVRWLTLLDPSFKFSYKIREENYKLMAGPSWPTYQDYFSHNWAGVDADIKKEIIECTKNETIDFITIQDKMQFIKNYIYHQHRTWSNWLKIEWAYRKDLDLILKTDHNYEKDLFVNLKTLVLTIDPDMALKHLLKFNSHLNFTNPLDFKEKLIQMMKNNSCVTGDVKFMSATILYQPQLNYKFYQELINWFELSDYYDYANEIHQIWFQLNQKATNDFVNYVNNIYSDK